MGNYDTRLRTPQCPVYLEDALQRLGNTVIISLPQ